MAGGKVYAGGGGVFQERKRKLDDGMQNPAKVIAIATGKTATQKSKTPGRVTTTSGKPVSVEVGALLRQEQALKRKRTIKPKQTGGVKR